MVINAGNKTQFLLILTIYNMQCLYKTKLSVYFVGSKTIKSMEKTTFLVTYLVSFLVCAGVTLGLIALSTKASRCILNSCAKMLRLPTCSSG